MNTSVTLEKEGDIGVIVINSAGRTVEQQQDPAARRVGERREMVDDCGSAAVHPYNRMEGYIRPGRAVNSANLALGNIPLEPDVIHR